jgi:hypothetical protein
MTLPELQSVVEKHMLLADKYIIKLLSAFIVTSQLPINPLWLFVVGPPSGGKTRLLSSLTEYDKIYKIDNLTSNTFASGNRSSDGSSSSLLDRLQPNAILMFLDFTTMISKEGVSQGEIIGQMRRIYDGEFYKSFGNGMNFKWQGKISVLAGVTEKIYPTSGMFADMGERYLMYEFRQPDRKEVGHRAADNLEDASANLEMTHAFAEFINGLTIPAAMPKIDQTTKDQIVDLAEFVTRARTPVERKKFSRDDRIEMKFTPEMPPRFVKQVLGLAMGLMVVNGGEILEEDRRMLCKIALDSIHPMRRQCLQALTLYDVGVETKALGAHLRYPTDSIRMHLENLEAVEVIDRIVTPNKHLWKIKSQYKDIMQFYEGIKSTGKTLEEEEDPVPEEMFV